MLCVKEYTCQILTEQSLIKQSVEGKEGDELW
jgi:hypothetical protein